MVKPEQDATVDYYALLEINIKATSDEIKKQYRKLALLYHPDRNRGQEQSTVEKFQKIQQANEVLSDPNKRATYDQIRGVHIRTYQKTTFEKTTSSTPSRARHRNPANGFSKTTPNKQRSAFGHFTTKEPPWSARRPPAPSSAKPAPTSARASAKSPEKEKADAYFTRFKERTSQSHNTASSSPKKPVFTQPMKDKSGQQPKSPRKTSTRFGTTFSEDEGTEEDTFYSFSSNGGTFNGTEKKGMDGDGLWSGRKTAYSHIFAGIKEDLRSPSKSNGQSTGFASDGFKKTPAPSETKKEEQTNGFKAPDFDPLRDFNLGTSPRKFSGTSPSKFGFGDGIGNESEPLKNTFPQSNATSTNGTSDASSNPKPSTQKPVFTNGTFDSKPSSSGFTFNATSNGTSKTTFNFQHTPAQRKTPQPQPTPEPEPPLDPNEIPKTPPPVEERRFAFAFSKLDVNGTAKSPTKQPKPVNLEEWTKKFEGMNPFMSPETKKLSEDKNFWSSVPLKSSARKPRTPKVYSRKEDWNSEEPNDNVPKPNIFGSTGMPPVQDPFESNIFPSQPKQPTFNFDMPGTGGPSTPQSTQQPTPAPTPASNLFRSAPPPPPTSPLSVSKPSNSVPKFNPPPPPKKLIPNPSNPKEFTFCVPPKSEMASLAEELQKYHAAYIFERARFEAVWHQYEQSMNLTDELSLRAYLDTRTLMLKERDETEALHALCLERWGAVAKFSGFTTA